MARPRLFFCNTLYSQDVPIDINPLILAANPGKRTLVIAAREGSIHRIQKLKLNVDVYGWWELKDKGFFSKDGISYAAFGKYEIIIVVSKERINSSFYNMLHNVQSFCAK